LRFPLLPEIRQEAQNLRLSEFGGSAYGAWAKRWEHLHPPEGDYRRETAIDKRRELMGQWAAYLGSPVLELALPRPAA
jgi:hypothetical protein